MVGMSEKTGIKYTTLAARLKDEDGISDMRLKELWKIVDISKLSDDELLSIIKMAK